MAKKKENSKGDVKRRKKVFRLRNIFISIFVVLFAIQYVQIQKLFADFYLLGDRDSSLITEIGQIKDAYTQIGGDLGEVREYLRLPTSNYGGFEELVDASEDDGKNTDNVQLALFKYVDYLNRTRGLDENVAMYSAYLIALGADEGLVNYMAGAELTFSDLANEPSSSTLWVLGPNSEKLVLFYLDKELGVLYFKTAAEKSEVGAKSSEQFVTDLKTYLVENKDELLENVRKLEAKKSDISNAIAAAADKIAELEISLDDQYIEENLALTYTVENKLGEAIGDIVLNSTNLELTFIDLNNADATVKATDAGTALVPFLEKLDTRTFIEKKAIEAHETLKKTLNDGGFKALLFESGLTVAEESREDEERIYYDIYDGDTMVSSLVIEKMTGVINIVQPDGTNAENLLFFDPEFKKKTLVIPDQIPDYGDDVVSNDNSFNILIAGKNGSLVDTMIFAHVDEDKRSVRMISIPRDLYYNGRKINAFANYYGMPELKKVLGDLTGYELDKYILIDMYAFIDVVDLIGGVDVTLESAVIDPTYRTVDNGVEGTLYYEPGDYHLGGKEALRLARTRHTSSDFARAARQQMILEAMQSKAQNFGFGDADTIYAISKTILSKTETDISLDEAIAYYFRYQNYEIQSNDVMSSGNVLYVPPYITRENCNRLIAEAEAAGQPRPGCENDNQAYTLLPRNNNWNVVKWFFREKFEAV